MPAVGEGAKTAINVSEAMLFENIYLIKNKFKCFNATGLTVLLLTILLYFKNIYDKIHTKI